MQRSGWRDLTERHLATAAPRAVLLVEDDEVYVERMRSALIDAHPKAFRLEVSRTMAHAENALRSSTFDVILLDLGLPDEHGMRSFERLHKAAPLCPIVVISSSDDPELASRLLYLGAQDYLIKGASDDLLLHVLGRAISRASPDAGRLPAIAPDPDGRMALSERDAGGFATLVQQYLAIVALATRQRILRDSRASYRESLRVLAEQLGRGGAGARDALEVHKQAVRQTVQTGSPDLHSWVAESRLVALELLAQLTEYYRARARDED